MLGLQGIGEVLIGNSDMVIGRKILERLSPHHAIYTRQTLCKSNDRRTQKITTSSHRGEKGHGYEESKGFKEDDGGGGG